MCLNQTNNGFVIIAVYVDDLNIIGTPNEIEETMEYDEEIRDKRSPKNKIFSWFIN